MDIFVECVFRFSSPTNCSGVRVGMCVGFWATVEDWSHRSAAERGDKNQPVVINSWKRHIRTGRWEIPAYSVPEFQID